MPITLAQAKVGMADKVNQAVVDEFRRESFILDKLTFDNAVSPGTGGSTLTYGYMQLLTPSLATGRQLNADYQPGEALRTEKTSKIKIMGGSFEVDRVLEDTSAKSEIAFQTAEKVKATRNYFHNLFINGDSSAHAEEFDGLDKLVTGTATEMIPATAIDVSTPALVGSNGATLVQALHDLVEDMAEKPDMFLMNGRMKSILQTIGYNMGYYERTKDDFGRQVDTFDGIQIVNMGKYFNGSNNVDVIPVTSDKTAIYAVKLGLNGVHGISPTGNKIIKSYMPDLKAPGAVKKGEVELLAGIVVKNSLMAGVLRNIKVA